jgi:hypothetical protein
VPKLSSVMQTPLARSAVAGKRAALPLQVGSGLPRGESGPQRQRQIIVPSEWDAVVARQLSWSMSGPSSATIRTSVNCCRRVTHAQVPLILRSWPPALQAVGETLAEFLALVPNRLIGDDDATFSQEQLDIPQAEADLCNLARP